MTHLLDTNICSAHMRRPGGLAHRFFQHAGGLAVPTIVVAEALLRCSQASRLVTALDRHCRSPPGGGDPRFRPDVRGEVRGVNGDLLRRGIAVPPMDLLIASVALAHDLTLMTHNTADFRNTPGLRLEDWLTP